MITGNQEYIRDMNRHLVLTTIKNTESISRANLAKQLHLTKATISAIVQELIDQELVVEIGSADTSKGRKPILLRFDKNCGYVITMDISPDKITTMISDLNGTNCIVKEKFTKEPYVPTASIIKIIQNLIHSLGSTPYGVVGICIGIHGVAHKNKIKFTPYYQMEDHNLGAILQDYFHIPVFVENEANLSAIGEYAFHYTKKNIIYINIHSGIGIGIMMNGTLFKGSGGHAGEIGHTILFPKGRKCPCGNEGCLEQYASEKAILEDYARQKKYSFVTIEKFIRDYQSGDEIAVQLIRNFVLYMSIGINNILNTLNPEIIIFNSSFTNYIPGLINEIQNNIQNFLGRELYLTTGEMQDISELLGGVHICVENFLNPNSQIF